MLKNKFSQTFVAFLLVALLTACGSTEKNAREKLEEGDYDAAVTLYERVVKNDPNNAEAVANLKRAREGSIGNRLIDVRKSRMAGNGDQGLDQLLSVFEREKTWNVFPGGGAKYTQEEEVGYAWKTYQAKIQSAVSAKQPLQAETIWRRYAPVFSEAKYSKGVQSLHGSVLAAGKTQCSQLAREAKNNYPYYANFVSRFCRHFKAGVRVSADESSRLNELYSGVDYEGSISGLPSEYFGFMRSAWDDALKSSPWYDPKGKKHIKVRVDGQYHFDHQKTLVTRVHEYKENEKYDEIENVAKTRQVPYQATRWETDPKDGILKQKTVTEVRTETYNEPVKVTKTREVAKNFPYSALYHQINVDLSRSFEAKLGDRSFSISNKLQGQAQGDEQNLKRDDIGLMPSKAPLLDPAEWVKKDATSVTEEVRSSLAREWQLTNCAQGDGGTSPAAVGNYALRCGRDPANANAAVVNEWYKNAVGLSASETEALLAEK